MYTYFGFFVSASDLRPVGVEVAVKGKRGRPRKHAPKIPLPPLYVFIRNLLHNGYYNPRIVSWVSDTHGIFKVWGLSVNYCKISQF
jgi:hypothetical protein